jgi:hypothetical protein
VNLTANTVRVSHKPERGWAPKAYTEREIPIRRSWLGAEALEDRSERLPAGFFYGKMQTQMDFLDCLKAVAELWI